MWSKSFLEGAGLEALVGLSPFAASTGAATSLAPASPVPAAVRTVALEPRVSSWPAS